MCGINSNVYNDHLREKTKMLLQFLYVETFPSILQNTIVESKSESSMTLELILRIYCTLKPSS